MTIMTENLYVDLRSTLGHALFLKCEVFNFAGSVKLKAALAMVEAAERDGLLRGSCWSNPPLATSAWH